MDTVRPKRTPWKSWRDFTSWAQDFSLKKKVLGGFLGVVILVGLVTSFIGIRLARETIIDRARTDLAGDLSTAAFVLRETRETLDRKIQLSASSETIRELLEKRDMAALRNRLVMISVENDMDFLSVADPRGRVLARGFKPESKGADLSSDPIVMAASEGRGVSGVRLISVERLAEENPTVVQMIGAKEGKTGMVMEAAHPIVKGNAIVGVVYGGIILNLDKEVVDRISHLVFRGQQYQGRNIGYVGIYVGDEAISSTLKGDDGLMLVGFKAGPAIQDTVLEKGKQAIDWESRFGHRYLSAFQPIRNRSDKVIGMLQLARLEKPIGRVIDRLVGTFLVVALLGVLLMAAISYFLVQWINRPLELILNSARRAAEGDLSQEVPVISRDEMGELAATFNLMMRNLAESRERLEQWGKELASKVAVQTGALDQAREQVARVQKLASLEKMADGMSHIMAHISDPLGGQVPGEDEEGATSRILVVDSDEKVLDVCGRILDNEGFEVHKARTVEEAFEHLEELIFDVLVVDIDMGDMGGKELLKEIKYRQPDLLVIITAPFNATEQAQEAVELGAFDYIPKPFGPHQILLMVYTALQTRQTVDRTRREHAEQRAEKIFQRLPVAIALADRAHRVVYNNRAFVELAAKEGQEKVQGKTFKELFGVDPLDVDQTEDTDSGPRRLELEKLGRTAKLYNFKLAEEDLRVLMLLDVTETVKKGQQADEFRAETLTRAQQVIHQQMRVAQEIAGLLGETTAETKAALFELIKLAKDEGETR